MAPSNPDHELTDDIVADLLARDARASSIKYSSLGMEAYAPRRPTGSAPTVNTRFLKNILRDTTVHNKALLEKEAEEARDRQRRLQGRTADQDRRLGRRDGDRTDRKHGQRDEKDKHGERNSRRRHHDDDRSERRRYRSRSRSHDRHRDRHDCSKQEHKRRDPSKSRSPDRDEERHSRRRRSRERRSRHHRHRSRSRSTSPTKASRSTRSRQSRTPVEDRKASSKRAPQSPSPAPPASEAAYDSDPLADLIGPPLPNQSKQTSRPRGRGATSAHSYGQSAMDARFSNIYDPNLDITPDSPPLNASSTRPDSDWDMALEALRDREIYKRKGAERMREAGFGEADIKRWEKSALRAGGASGADGDVEDVVWSKKGEGREWDRGKVVEGDGSVAVKPEWARMRDEGRLL